MEYSDILIIFWLILLEGLLSVDNALVLALMVSVLPKHQQKKALRYGIWGAFIFRVLAVLLAFILIKLRWFKILGGLYLFYIAYAGLNHHQRKSGNSAGYASNFWMIVLNVELMDMAFSIDSILAAVALSDKKWLIITGGILGIIMMRYTAGIFIKLLERFSILKKTAYVLVILIGLKLVLSVWWHMPEWLFFGTMFLILGGALLKSHFSQKRH